MRDRRRLVCLTPPCESNDAIRLDTSASYAFVSCVYDLPPAESRRTGSSRIVVTVVSPGLHERENTRETSYRFLRRPIIITDGLFLNSSSLIYFRVQLYIYIQIHSIKFTRDTLRDYKLRFFSILLGKRLVYFFYTFAYHVKTTSFHFTACNIAVCT